MITSMREPQRSQAMGRPMDLDRQLTLERDLAKEREQRLYSDIMREVEDKLSDPKLQRRFANDIEQKLVEGVKLELLVTNIVDRHMRQIVNPRPARPHARTHSSIVWEHISFLTRRVDELYDVVRALEHRIDTLKGQQQ